MTFLKPFPFEDSPFFQHTVGFDRVFDQLERVRGDLEGRTQLTKYPPYNIVKTSDDEFQIELALAGFSKEDLDVEVKENVLSVKGSKTEEDGKRSFVHKGIGGRSFERHFTLADHVEVVGGDLVDGILVVELKRVIPESELPKKIKLGEKVETKKTLLTE